jgi:type II secretory pathway component GspD/PulD (secretin)
MRKTNLAGRSALTLLLSALLIAAFAPLLCAQSASPSSPPGVSLDLVSGDVQDILHKVLQAHGASFVIEGVKGEITLLLEGRSLEDILNTICAAKGAFWWKEENGTYIISAQPRKSNSASPASADPSPSLAARSAKGPRRTERRVLNYLAPLDVAYLFGAAPEPKTKQLLYPSFQQRVEPQFQLWQGENRAVTSSSTPGSMGGAVTGGMQQLAGLPGGLGSLAGLGGLGGGISGLQGQMGGGGLYGGGGISGLQGQMGQFGGGQYGGGGISGLQGVLLRYLPEDMEPEITAYEPLNALLIYGTEEEVQEVLKIIELIDQKPRQVIIEVQVVDIQTKFAHALGIDWAWATGSLTFDVTGFAPGGNVSVGYVRGQNFAATMSTLLTEQKARLVSSSRVRTLNRVPASIQVQTTYPYVQFGAVTAGGVGGTAVGQTATLGSLSIPTGLTVLAAINGLDEVMMDLSPTLTDVVGQQELPTGGGQTQTLPIWTSRSVSSLAIVKDGETVVLGGLVKKSESVSYNKIPILSDLPVLGRLLFTRTSKSIDDVETLIFVTPHIVREEEAPVTTGPVAF